LARLDLPLVEKDVTMISYAQNAEDVVLRRVFADVVSGFYVDVGAWDPTAESVTKVFYDSGWTGLNLEPQSQRLASFDLLRPRDTNLCLAASDVAGTTMLLVTQFSPLSTVEASILDSNNPNYNVVDRVETPTLPLASIFDKHARDRLIHFLKIDVEGHEEAVLRGADFQRHRPIVLVIESICPTTYQPRWSAWESLVLNAGYRFALFDGLNRFYVCKERTDLLPKLSCGANCMDGYITAREAQLRARLQAAEKELGDTQEALAAARGSNSS
jgi:FkbM family methyltransferase